MQRVSGELHYASYLIPNLDTVYVLADKYSSMAPVLLICERGDGCAYWNARLTDLHKHLTPVRTTFACLTCLPCFQSPVRRLSPVHTLLR